ncbi:MAG: HAMP domain-containing sensor histidine kinase, partial [Candidatus Limnocylindrales bacterium]
MRPSIARRIARTGLQRRIMLYVVVGLALMFGALLILDLSAISRATDLVYQERLTTAYTTAGILDRDFARLAADALETAQENTVTASPAAPGAAADLLAHLDRPDPQDFFSVSGVEILDPGGALVDQAGLPRLDASSSATALTRLGMQAKSLRGPYAVAEAVDPIPGSIPFASIAVRLGAADDLFAPVAVMTTVSNNATTDFVPAWYGSPNAGGTAAGGVAGAAGYHLEVVDPAGIAILGMGSDEQPGKPSKHFPVIQPLMASGGAAAQLHEPGPNDTFAAHVMAVVPVAGTPFYLVLEQPVDVALALPIQLRNELLIATGVGFLAVLAVAWVTTRRVVRPTQQLTLAAERMAGGDLASPIEVTAQDEIGRLAESLEAMRQRLRAATEQAERTNRELELRVAERTSRLGQLLHQTITAQEEERRRLARELHDETAQTLAALSISLDRARDALAGAPPQTLERVNEARTIAARLLAETRRLIVGLRPAVLDDLGLLPAIRWYAESTLAEAGVEVAIEADAPASRLPDHMETALFRITQEAMTNVAKHARAHHATIALRVDDATATVSVSDDGCGFEVADALGRGGADEASVGLVGIQERVRLLNGRLEITSTPGHGTTIRVTAP